MSFIQSRALPLLSALSILILIACGRPESLTPLGSDTPRYGGTLRVTDPADFRTLDPAVGYDTTTSFGIHLLFNSLVGYDEELNIVPELAESFTVSPDGKVFTFVLRRGVRFHNGRELVASDVSYALHRVLSPKTASPGSMFYSNIRGARAYIEGRAKSLSGIEILGPYHLRFVLDEPDMTFLQALALPFAAPLPREAVEAPGVDFGRNPVGTGPFKLKKWQSGELVRFVRHDGYFEAGQPYLDAIDFVPGYSVEVAFLKFEQGEIDHVERLTSPDYLYVKSTPELAKCLVAFPAFDVFGEFMNTEMPPFDNKLVRKAVSHAINRETLVKLRNGRIHPLAGPLPPGLPGYDPDIVGYPYDPDKARALLKEAGFKQTEPIPYWTLQTEAAVQLGQAVQQDLKAVGMNIEMKIVDFPTYLTGTGRRHTAPFGYSAWIMDFPDPANFLIPLYHSGSAEDGNATNAAFYKNPAVDRLLDAAQIETDIPKRRALYKEAMAIIIDDAPYAYEYNSLTTELAQPWVKNYRGDAVWPRNMRRVWLDLPGTRDTLEVRK